MDKDRVVLEKFTFYNELSIRKRLCVLYIPHLINVETLCLYKTQSEHDSNGGISEDYSLNTLFIEVKIVLNSKTVLFVLII